MMVGGGKNRGLRARELGSTSDPALDEVMKLSGNRVPTWQRWGMGCRAQCSLRNLEVMWPLRPRNPAGEPSKHGSATHSPRALGGQACALSPQLSPFPHPTFPHTCPSPQSCLLVRLYRATYIDILSALAVDNAKELTSLTLVKNGRICILSENIFILSATFKKPLQISTALMILPTSVAGEGVNLALNNPYCKTGSKGMPHRVTTVFPVSPF